MAVAGKPPPCWECPSCGRTTDSFHCYVTGCEWLVCTPCALLFNAYELIEVCRLSDLKHPEAIWSLPALGG